MLARVYHPPQWRLLRLLLLLLLRLLRLLLLASVRTHRHRGLWLLLLLPLLHAHGVRNAISLLAAAG